MLEINFPHDSFVFRLHLIRYIIVELEAFIYKILIKSMILLRLNQEWKKKGFFVLGLIIAA